jgi:hypothetical protein
VIVIKIDIEEEVEVDKNSIVQNKEIKDKDQEVLQDILHIIKISLITIIHHPILKTIDKKINKLNLINNILVQIIEINLTKIQLLLQNKNRDKDKDKNRNLNLYNKQKHCVSKILLQVNSDKYRES